MRRLRRYVVAALAILALTGAAAPSGCEDAPPVPPPGVSDMIVGASLLRSSTAGGATYPGAYVIARAGQPVESVQADITAQARAGRIRRLVILDFPINNALQGGWTDADRWRLWEAMWQFPGCVVVGAIVYTPGHPSAAQFDAANRAVAGLVAERSAAGYPTALSTGWADAVHADPSLILGPNDYLHMNPARQQAAVDAYARTTADARGMC